MNSTMKDSFTTESQTANCVMDALDDFFLTPSLANMVTVLHALQAHRALRFSRSITRSGNNETRAA